MGIEVALTRACDGELKKSMARILIPSQLRHEGLSYWHKEEKAEHAENMWSKNL